MTKNLSAWLSKPSVYLLILACIFLGDLLFGGHIFLSRDALSDFMPMRLYEAKTLASGHIPFWNPFWGGGKPFIADTTSQALYPVNLLFLIFAPATAFNLYWLFHVYLAGLGVHFLFRQFHFSKYAAGLMAVSFMFGASLIAQLEFPYNGAAMVWMPWIFGVLVRFHNAAPPDARNPFSELWKQRRLACALALLFAIQFLANFPEMIIYPFAGYVLYAIIAGIMAKSLRPVLTLALFAGVSGFAGLLITLPQTVPMWELVQFSERAGSFDVRFNMASISISHLLTAVFPFMGGFPGFPDKFWERGLFEFWVGTFYLGAMVIIVVPCALACLARRLSGLLPGRRPWIVLACMLVVIGIILSMGENTPIYPWIHAHVPLMNRFRFPSKFLILSIMGLLMLGASGIDALIAMRTGAEKNKAENPDKSKAMTGVSSGNALNIVLAAQAAIVLACGILALVFWIKPALLPGFAGMSGARVSQQALAKAGLYGMITWGFLLVSYLWVVALAKARLSMRALAVAGMAIVFCNLFFVSRQIHPAGPASVMSGKAPEVAGAASTGYRVFSIYSGVQQYLYADTRPELYEWALRAGSGGMWLPFETSQFYQAGTKFLKYKNLEGLVYSQNRQAGENALDMFGVRWMVYGAQWPEILWGNAPREIHISERPNAIPRFKMFNDWAAVETDEAVLQALARGGFSPSRLLVEPAALYKGKSDVSVVSNPGNSFASGLVSVEKMTVNGATLRTNTLGRNMLCFGDTWFPGWRAKIDGAEVSINRVNYMFMGVEVPPGTHVVEFNYYPTHFTLCVIISLLTIAFIICLAASGLRNPRNMA